jgi:hypothetical protein
MSSNLQQKTACAPKIEHRQFVESIVVQGPIFFVRTEAIQAYIPAGEFVHTPTNQSPRRVATISWP